MIKFFITFFILVAISSLLLIYLGGQKFKPTKPKPYQLDLSLETHKKVFNWFRYIYRLIAILIIVFMIIPMAKDIPVVLKNEYNHVSGKPTNINKGPFGSWYISQSIIINDQRVRLYFHYNLIKNDKEYQVYYLPNSRYVINIKEKM
jgi:hypothetical protein